MTMSSDEAVAVGISWGGLSADAALPQAEGNDWAVIIIREAGLKSLGG